MANNVLGRNQFSSFLTLLLMVKKTGNEALYKHKISSHIYHCDRYITSRSHSIPPLTASPTKKLIFPKGIHIHR